MSDGTCMLPLSGLLDAEKPRRHDSFQNGWHRNLQCDGLGLDMCCDWSAAHADSAKELAMVDSASIFFRKQLHQLPPRTDARCHDFRPLLYTFCINAIAHHIYNASPVTLLHHPFPRAFTSLLHIDTAAMPITSLAAITRLLTHIAPADNTAAAEIL